MLSLASIDSDDSDGPSPDDMQVDCIIHDEDGRAIGETRRLRPPLANADYGTTGDTNMRLIKNIGHDPHAVRRQQKETRAAFPRSDIYDGVSENRQVTERIASAVTERVSKNRTGDIPPRPEPDAARLPYMNGFHDMRAVDERGSRLDPAPTRRALTETHVRNQTTDLGASSAIMRVIYGVYDKLTHGLRHDKIDHSTRLPSADTENRMRTVSAMREYDPNRGKGNSRVTPRPPDAYTVDQFGLNATSDHVSYERTSLVLPIAGYGQISIEGTWNSAAPTHDRIEHELLEVEVAEMELHRGQLVPCNAHPTHTDSTGFDGVVRAGVNVAPTLMSRGQAYSERGRSDAAGSDRLVRPGSNVSVHEQRFGKAPEQTVGPLQPAGDGVGRQGRPGADIDINRYEQRFGQAHPATGGLSHHRETDRIFRAELDASAQHQRAGHSTRATAGPLQPPAAGFDAVYSPGVDTSLHMQRFGVGWQAALGPLQPTASDATTRTELDASSQHQRFGVERQIAFGPLQPTASDATTRTELDASSEHQRFGVERQVALGPLQPTASDATTRTELDTSSQHQRLGYIPYASAGPLQPAAAGFDAYYSPGVDASAHMQRFGVEPHAELGPLQPTVLDATIRTALDSSSQCQRFGHATHATAGPLLPPTSGFDAVYTAGADASVHQQRFGVALHTALGPLQPTASDDTPRTELDSSSQQQRFGHSLRATAGPLQPSPAGFDAIARTELDTRTHLQNFGLTQGVYSHPTELGSTAFDGNSTRRTELEIESHSRQMGQVGVSAPMTATQQKGAGEGRSSRVSPLNSSELSRGMAPSSVYQGSSRLSVDSDRSALRRTELSSSAPTCGARSTTTAAATHPLVASDAIRLTNRAMYEANEGNDFAADLSWVSHGATETTREPPRVKAPDKMSVVTLPCDSTHAIQHHTALGQRDAAPKKTLHPIHERHSATQPQVFTQLPVIYESRRRLVASTEIQRPPPGSEFPPATQPAGVPPYNITTR